MAVVGREVHPDRWNPTTTIRKRGVVIHDSESSDSSAQALCDLMARPGDRPNGSGGFYGASYHVITTNDPKDVMWHICMPGRVTQGRDGWLDAASRDGIRAVANFIVQQSQIDGFPLERCSVSDLLAGDGGYCGHVDVSNAWHDSDHTDPGPTFPWDVLAADIAALTQNDPKPPVPPIPAGDDMQIAVLRMTNTHPMTDFLGYAEPTADPKSPKFFKVLWVDGLDPQMMKMYQDQLAGGAKIYEFGEHVSISLFLENDELPSSTHSDGRPWSVADWGYTNA
jgi:hypothetical protein